MKINRKIGLAVGAGVLSVGIFGVAGFAYFESNVAPVSDTAVVTQPVATPDPSASAAPMPDQTKPDALRQLAKGLTESAATYLGVAPTDLATQLKAGKSLADIATATAGRSRDGLVAALTTAATTKIDAAVTDGTLTTDQAAMAKQKLSAEIAKLVDRTGHK
jgi:hypothetical protein